MGCISHVHVVKSPWTISVRSPQYKWNHLVAFLTTKPRPQLQTFLPQLMLIGPHLFWPAKGETDGCARFQTQNLSSPAELLENKSWKGLLLKQKREHLSACYVIRTIMRVPDSLNDMDPEEQHSCYRSKEETCQEAERRLWENRWMRCEKQKARSCWNSGEQLWSNTSLHSPR